MVEMDSNVSEAVQERATPSSLSVHMLQRVKIHLEALLAPAHHGLLLPLAVLLFMEAATSRQTYAPATRCHFPI